MSIDHRVLADNSATALIRLMSSRMAVGQEAIDCSPQIVAQLLGFEEITGCTNAETGSDDGITEVGDVETNGPLFGLQTAHEASGGQSTSSLDHANEMSGGTVLAAHSGRVAGDNDDDSYDDDDSGGRPPGRRRPSLDRSP